MLERKSVRGKLLAVVLATTAAALTITGAVMVLYDLHTFRERWVSDLSAQADILSLAAAPALEFQDPQSAEEYVELFRVRRDMTGAAIYTAKGALFASYSAPASDVAEFPQIPETDGHHFSGNELVLFKRIVANNEILGTVYLRASYDLYGRLRDYIGILAAVLVFSLTAAVLMSGRLQRSITGPISNITSVARRVMEQRDFSLRAQKTTDDEVGVLVTAFNSMLQEIGERTEVLEASNQQLQREVQERERAQSARHSAEQDLRTLNAELEQRVAERTSQLEAANKDLEGFSYSVSHDLRAPIRAIGGFCTLLSKDHDAQLDAEAKRKIGIIKKEAERMGVLIDDLLAFSRLGRKALQPADVDMAQLVSNAYRRLTENQGSSNVVFRLGSLPHAVGDRSLFEQVWINLLSNAIKFSSKKAEPVIEVGAISDAREHVYFVRDNGAGFDPKYQANLFGVFQRLHHQDEFAGTGVGLALVHRIVTRHGGRIWADAKLGEGATFHFTLPKEQ